MRYAQILTPRGIVFLVLGLSTVAGGVVLGYPDLTRIGVLLAVLPALGLLISRRRAPELAVTRTVSPTRLQPDEPGLVGAAFCNVGPRRTPLYLAQEHLDVHLGDRPRFVLNGMDRGETRTLDYHIRSSSRGAYPLGPLSLRQRDPFGLTYVAVRLSSTAEVIVLPRVFDLKGPGPAASGRGSEGEQLQMVALHGEDDVSIRQYRAGDELRRVHWPATAHRGQLMVRQEDRPARRRAVLLLDCRSSAHGRAPRSSPSFEYAICALASTARALMLKGYVVHLLSNQTVSDGSGAHPMDMDTLLDALARARRDDDIGLNVVAGAAHSFTAGGVLAVAALVAHDAADIRHLAAVHEHGSTAMAFVLDRNGFSTPRRASKQRDDEAVDATLEPLRVLNEAGWMTTLCTAAINIPDAWMSLHHIPLGSRVR